MEDTTRGLGDNTQVSYFETETARLKQDYGHFEETVNRHIAESTPITVINDQAGKDFVTAHIKKMRETYKLILGTHVAEKTPHLERGRAADGLFFGLMARLGRKEKKDRPGEADRLNALLTDYDVRVLAAEQERLRKIAEDEERKRQEAERERIRLEQEAEDARLAAERARKPETQAAKEAVADVKEEAASAARVEETVASARAEEAYIGAIAAPKDIMRQRSSAGVTSGMAEEKFVEITDLETLDLLKLRPYLAPADLEKAIRKYAESKAYSSDASVQITGARFGKRPKSRVY